MVAKTYEKNDLSFSYPDNWKINEDEMLEEGARYVTVEDSDNSLFIMTVFAPGDAIDLETYGQNFLAGLSTDIPGGRISDAKKSAVRRTVNNQNLEGIEYKYSAVVLGESIPHTANMFSVKLKKGDAVIVVQAPDEDWKAADKEFQVIFDSLKFE